MITKLFCAVAGWFVDGLSSLIPAPPTFDAIVIPWPDFVPVWPVITSIGIIVVAGALFASVRVLRWVYGLVPFLQ